MVNKLTANKPAVWLKYLNIPPFDILQCVLLMCYFNGPFRKMFFFFSCPCPNGGQSARSATKQHQWCWKELSVLLKDTLSRWSLPTWGLNPSRPIENQQWTVEKYPNAIQYFHSNSLFFQKDAELCKVAICIKVWWGVHCLRSISAPVFY